MPREWPLEASSVAVIGNGNVALDVARILAKHADDLLPTEIPANVYAGLKASPVTDVHVFGRRGPTQVKFSPLEMRELGELRDVDMIVHDEDFDYDDAARTAIATNKQILVIDKVFGQWREREVGSASRRSTSTSSPTPPRWSRARTGASRPSATSAPSRMARAACGARASSARSPCRPSTVPSGTSGRRSTASRSTSVAVSSRTTRVR